MLRKALKALSVICAGTALMTTAPANAVFYIMYFDGANIVGAEGWDDAGNYCGLWGYRTGIINTYQSPPGLGIGCP